MRGLTHLWTVPMVASPGLSENFPFPSFYAKNFTWDLPAKAGPHHLGTIDASHPMPSYVREGNGSGQDLLVSWSILGPRRLFLAKVGFL